MLDYNDIPYFKLCQMMTMKFDRYAKVDSSEYDWVEKYKFVVTSDKPIKESVLNTVIADYGYLTRVRVKDLSGKYIIERR